MAQRTIHLLLDQLHARLDGNRVVGLGDLRQSPGAFEKCPQVREHVPVPAGAAAILEDLPGEHGAAGHPAETERWCLTIRVYLEYLIIR